MSIREIVDYEVERTPGRVVNTYSKPCPKCGTQNTFGLIAFTAKILMNCYKCFTPYVMDVKDRIVQDGEDIPLEKLFNQNSFK